MALPNLAQLTEMKRRNDMATKKRAVPGREKVPEGLRVVKVGVFSVYLKK